MNLCVAIFLTIGLGVEGGTQPHVFGAEPTALARLECHVTNNWSVEYNHYSSLRDGKPFNDRSSLTADVLSINYRLQLK